MKTPLLCLLALVLLGCSTTPRSNCGSNVSSTDSARYHHELLSESAEGTTDFLVLVSGE